MKSILEKLRKMISGRRSGADAVPLSSLDSEHDHRPWIETQPQPRPQDAGEGEIAQDASSEIERLKAQIISMKDAQSRFRAQIETMKATQRAEKDRTAQMQTRLCGQIETMRSSITAQTERIEKLRTSHAAARARLVQTAPNAPLNRFLAFAQGVAARAEECRADVYLAHGVQALPAVDRLRAITGGTAACDVIEIPSFSMRAIPSKWDPTVLKTLDHAFQGYLREADFALTVGWALGDIIAQVNPDVRVVPNWRNHAKLTVTGALREEFAIAPDAKVVLAISTIASGFEDVLEAIAAMQGDVHLVIVGTFAPREYEERIIALCSTLGLDDRVHFRGPVPYHDMIGYCGGADIGLIVRDPSIPNNYISLPNRVFDYLACGLPIVAPRMPDIHRILETHNCGLSIDAITATAWAKGIAEAIGRRDEMRMGAIEASAQMTWETLERDRLLEALGNPSSVTFAGFNDLTLNNRTMRMARSLTRLGVTAKVACPMSKDATVPDGVIAIPFEKY